MNLRSIGAGSGVGVLLFLFSVLSVHAESASPILLAHGRYLTVIGGCNDCHTAGYAESGGRVPEKRWLTGSALGWHGPWGTTYPPNLRLFMRKMTLKRWLRFARTARLRPPMPYWSLRTMSVHDLTALYVFIRHLGAAGKAAPAYLPPGKTPRAPYVSWVLPTIAKGTRADKHP